jgi:L-lactate dehydrogenase complex protein LldG
MTNQGSRDEILARIRETIARRPEQVHETDYQSEDIFMPVQDGLSTFIQELEAVGGKCIVAQSEEDLQQKLTAFYHDRGFSSLFCRDASLTTQLRQLPIKLTNNANDFENMEAGITRCECLIARTGSVVVSSATGPGRQMHAFPPVHIVLAEESQLVSFPDEAIQYLQQKYGNNLPSAISFITGPSRTADIEKTLVMGAHGPKELFIFVRQMP